MYIFNWRAVAGRICILYLIQQYIVITRSYYRKESAASPPWDQRQHAEFAE